MTKISLNWHVTLIQIIISQFKYNAISRNYVFLRLFFFFIGLARKENPNPSGVSFLQGLSAKCLSQFVEKRFFYFSGFLVSRIQRKRQVGMSIYDVMDQDFVTMNYISKLLTIMCVSNILTFNQFVTNVIICSVSRFEPKQNSFN